jgi:hypothetical protein
MSLLAKFSVCMPCMSLLLCCECVRACVRACVRVCICHGSVLEMLRNLLSIPSVADFFLLQIGQL